MYFKRVGYNKNRRNTDLNLIIETLFSCEMKWIEIELINSGIEQIQF